MENFTKEIQNIKEKLQELHCPLIHDYEGDAFECWIKNILKPGDCRLNFLDWMISSCAVGESQIGASVSSPVVSLVLTKGEIVPANRTIVSVPEVPSAPAECQTYHMKAFSNLQIVPAKDVNPFVKATASIKQQFKFIDFMLDTIQFKTAALTIDFSLELSNLSASAQEPDLFASVQEMSAAKFLERTTKNISKHMPLNLRGKKPVPIRFPNGENFDVFIKNLKEEMHEFQGPSQDAADNNVLVPMTNSPLREAAEKLEICSSSYLTSHSDQFTAACVNVPKLKPSTIGSEEFLGMSEKLQSLCEEAKCLINFKKSIQSIDKCVTLIVNPSVNDLMSTLKVSTLPAST